MKSVALIPNSNRILVEGHQWRFTQTPLEYMAQKVHHTVSVFLGEWFMDRSIGIPYIPGEDLPKGMHRRMIETALQVRIGEIQGIEKFISFSPTFDPSTRILTVNFTVQIEGGERLSDSIEIGGR